MQITQNLKLKQSQSLVMTPQLQQAIKLLQLNNLELTDLVNKELEENPFLENESTEEIVEDFDENTSVRGRRAAPSPAPSCASRDTPQPRRAQRSPTSSRAAAAAA